ncbi:MAG: sodium/proline symporter [Xanthomonadales bacterium]|nr:sodium/proline symporter [Xanthomonadales bacterium]NIX13553.1 sodium/proline symporter [Xanthomonadales bacterium]
MEKTTVVIVTLVAYKLLLIGIGFWAKSRNRNATDFFLGGRGLGPLVAAVSYSSSASSAWTLLGVSGITYVIGVSALWIAAGSFTGMLVAWFWIGPRLMEYSRRHDHITLTDFLAHDAGGSMRRAIVITASAIIIFSFTFYVAAQFQGAGNTFASTFDLSMNQSILIGALIIMIYTMLGGFWAVSVTDTLQGLLMAFTALLLPVVALIEIGGPAGFMEGLRAVSTPEQLSWNGGSAGLLAAGFIIGALSIGFGTYGQPHLLVRFMALRDAKAMRQARVITIAWYSVVFLSMLFLGLVGHVLHQSVENPETIFFVLTDSLFPSFLGAVLLAAVLSAIMSTADSQLLVAASAIDHDLGLGRGRPERTLLISRLTIAFLVLFAVVVAIWLPERIFSRVLFAWIALGSAFGPTVFLRLGGFRPHPRGVLLSIATGFALAVAFYLMPNTPGDWLERLVPFCAALTVLWWFRNPAKSTDRGGSRT